MNMHGGQVLEEGDYPNTEMAALLPLSTNIPLESLCENIQHNARRRLPLIDAVEPHDRPAVIVGGGPSIVHHVDDIRKRQEDGAQVFALNGAGLWLQERGVIPDGLIVLDGRSHNVKFIHSLDKATTLYLAMQCHPDVFDRAVSGGYNIMTWHVPMGGKCNVGIKEERPVFLIGGGTSVGMRALRLVHLIGYRTVHLYGYDSSYKEDLGSHAYSQPENENDRLMEPTCNGKKFLSTPWMIRQADDFRYIAIGLMQEGMTIHIHGDGLLPEVARNLKLEDTDIELQPPVHPTAKIHERAHIGDNVTIGARTCVWQFASVIRGAVLGDDCVVAPGVTVDGAKFGNRCRISQGVALSPGFLFGDDVFIGPNASFCNDVWPSVSKENFDMTRFDRGEWAVIVMNGAAIGAGAVILPGVVVGANALVAAGATVTKNVPDNHLWQRDGTVIPINPPWRIYRMRRARC